MLRGTSARPLSRQYQHNISRLLVASASTLTKKSSSKAHDLTVSDEETGPNSINSLRTIGSLFRTKKKSSPCGPHFPGTFQCVDAVRKRSLSHGSNYGHTLSHKSLFHISGTMPQPSRPQAIEDHFHNRISVQKSSLARILHALQNFVQCHNRVFEVLLPQFQSRLISSQNVIFAFWVIKILSPVFGRLHFPQGSRFLTSIWLHCSRCLTHSFVVLLPFSPVPAFNTFVDRLARSMPFSVYQRRSPPVLHNVIDFAARFFSEPTSSVLSVNSLGPSLIDTSGHPLFELWPSQLNGPCTFLQRAYFQSTMIVHWYKVSQASIMPFSASFKKAFHNTLDWAIAIFLLVCQQLDCIDLVFTHTLRHRVRCKDLCLIGTVTCFYHH